MRLVLLLVACLLMGCEDRSDATGPGVVIHCDAATPQGLGDTTVKNACQEPAAAPRVGWHR